VVQRVLPQVVKGDKRIVLVEGRGPPAPWNRVGPRSTDNPLQTWCGAGAAEAAQLSPAPRKRDLPRGSARPCGNGGLIFVGIERDRRLSLTEINVTPLAEPAIPRPIRNHPCGPRSRRGDLGTRSRRG